MLFSNESRGLKWILYVSVNEIDNRATNYYVALYWAEACAEKDPAFQPVFEQLSAARPQIVSEFKDCQGKPADIGGYYLFDYEKTKAAMNPSKTLNALLEKI